MVLRSYQLQMLNHHSNTYPPMICLMVGFGKERLLVLESIVMEIYTFEIISLIKLDIIIAIYLDLIYVFDKSITI